MVNQASRSYVDRVALGLEGQRFEPSPQLLEAIRSKQLRSHRLSSQCTGAACRPSRALGR